MTKTKTITIPVDTLAIGAVRRGDSKTYAKLMVALHQSRITSIIVNKGVRHAA